MTIRRTASLGVSFLLVLTAAYAVVGSYSSSQEKVAFAATDTDFAITGLPTDRTPEEYQGSFLYTSSAEMLSAQNVTINSEDKVYAFPDPSFGLGSHIWVYRAQPILIKDAGDETLVRTWAKTVGEALDEQHIDLGEKDIVDPAKDVVLAIDGKVQTITITRVAETEITTKQDIAFTTTYKDDSDLEKGVQKTDQEGKVGTLQKTYKVRRENGKEVSRVLIGSKTLIEPVNKVVRRGTKIVSYGAGKASWYGGVPSMTAAHRTLPFGTKVLVTNTSNGKSVVVTIADRGPFVAGRIIDLSKDAFAAIASIGSGTASVTLEKTN